VDKSELIDPARLAGPAFADAVVALPTSNTSSVPIAAGGARRGTILRDG
jgi:hypothetical protein